jgi:hypothetical protein
VRAYVGGNTLLLTAEEFHERQAVHSPIASQATMSMPEAAMPVRP